MHGNDALSELGAGLFADMPELTTVVAHHSGLEALPADLFKNCVKLETAWLHNNAITTIDSTAFSGVGASLTSLWLHNNELSTLASGDSGVFSGLEGLKELLLTGNTGITKSNFGCGVLCDVPETANIEVFVRNINRAGATSRANSLSLSLFRLQDASEIMEKLYCGVDCEGEIGDGGWANMFEGEWEVNDSICPGREYEECVSWELNGAVGGWGWGGRGASVLGVLAVAVRLLV
jgi:hypothetical protein